MSLIRYFLYPMALPHLICYCLISRESKAIIQSDIDEMNRRLNVGDKGLIYWLVFQKPYRNMFYYRVPLSRFFRFLLPKYPLFEIKTINGFGGNAFVLNHPYSTIINARCIGRNFTICHLTTIGNAIHGRNDLVPTIGDNVSIGANVTVIGDIHIGNNVIIGAGSVVVKDVPDNCVIAGNPARIIRTL